MKNALGWIQIILFVVLLGFLYWIVKKILALLNPSGTAAWWGAFFGLSKPGTQVPDLTGQLGANIEAASQQAAMNAATPQLSYDQARGNYGRAHGIPPLSVEGTTDWPWTSFDAWQAAGTPTLPT